MPVATVVNFPTGDEPVSDVVQETSDALAAGADEIDLVLPYKAFLAGDVTAAEVMVQTIRAITRGKVLKVILETGSAPNRVAIRAASS
jgi:deoxyribose-phosphate aldolase